MIYLLMNWLYIGITTYLAGHALMRLLRKIFHAKTQTTIFHELFAGLLCTTLYAQIFSLFTKVGMLANILLLLGCIIYAVIAAKSIYAEWKEFLSKPVKEGLPGSKFIFPIVFLLILIVFALASAGPAKLIDTDWYHAQTIRWIEDYGCVKGVANLFYSLGFNSAQHYFDALYSLRFVFGQSMRGSGGYFALLLCIHGVYRLLFVQKHKSHTADAMAIAEIVYTVIITAFFADAYTDTLPNCLVLFILTEWIALNEENEQKELVENPFPLAFLCILGVFATVVKTSCVIVVLLVLQPAVYLIIKKKWVQIAGYLLTGILVAVPFFITNVITTGYLIYLASGLDFFNVPWKIDIEVLKYSVDSMVHDARGVNASMEAMLSSGLSWIPQWFLNDSISHQILYVGIVVLFIYDVVMSITLFIKTKTFDLWANLPRIIGYIGLVYWLFTIPQVKYCWAFLLFPLAAVPATYWQKHMTGKLAILVGAAILLMYTGFYGLRTLGYVKASIPNYLVKQADYEKHEMQEVTAGNQTFYIMPKEGDIVCGYYVFPYVNDVEILDQLVIPENLGDGFYLKSE